MLLLDILRVIWARGKARGDRWTEEVVIVLEEMRRTLAFCLWKSTWWRERQNTRSGSADLQDGATAYALKQAYIWESMAESFVTQWGPLIQRYKLPSDWPSPYNSPAPGSTITESAIDRKWVSRVAAALQHLSFRGTCDEPYLLDLSSTDSD